MANKKPTPSAHTPWAKMYLFLATAKIYGKWVDMSKGLDVSSVHF